MDSTNLGRGTDALVCRAAIDRVLKGLKKWAVKNSMKMLPDVNAECWSTWDKDTLELQTKSQTARKQLFRNQSKGPRGQQAAHESAACPCCKSQLCAELN